MIEKEKVVETVYVGGGPANDHSASSSLQSTPEQGAQPSSPSSSGNQKPENSGSAPSPAPAPAPAPQGISGVHDISVAVGTSMDSVFFELSQISAPFAVTIDASEVNTSIPGSYSVYYLGADGSSTTATVTVY